jgi:hypothetical protein
VKIEKHKIGNTVQLNLVDFEIVCYIYEDRSKYVKALDNYGSSVPVLGLIGMFTDALLLPVALLVDDISLEDEVIRLLLHEMSVAKNVSVISRRPKYWCDRWGFNIMGRSKQGAVLMINNY